MNDPIANALINAIPWDKIIDAVLAPVVHHHTHVVVNPNEAIAKNPYRNQNPYRESKTVADVEAMLLSQPSSSRREAILQELAQYQPETSLSSLSASSFKLLSGS